MTYNIMNLSFEDSSVYWSSSEGAEIRTIELDDCPAVVQIVKNSFSAKQLETWSLWLSESERQRLSQFRFECDRELFLARRGLVRSALHSRTQIAPDEITFYETEFGKLVWGSKLDAMTPTFHSPDFCVSSDRDYVTVAVAGRMHRVGVDLERIGTSDEFDGMEEHILHPKELNIWRKMNGSKHIEAYANLYAVKEAFAKALGRHSHLMPTELCALDVLEGNKNSVVLWESRMQAPVVGLYWLCNVDTANRLAVVIV